MTLRVPELLGIVLAIAAVSGRDAATAELPTDPPTTSPTYIGTVRDTGQFLPDSAVLGRVDDQVIRVGEYVEAYFNSYAEFRPQADSLGRVRFLDSMIRREILARLAFAADRPMGFEDRYALRDYESQVLSNVLYQRTVSDKVTISDSGVRRLYDQFRRQVRLRHILFDDAAQARKVRLDLIGGRIGWSAAVKKYSRSKRNAPDGELGWTLRFGKDPAFADLVWSLRPGEISTPIVDAEGTHLIQLMEDRPYEAPSLESLRGQIEGIIRQQQMDSLASTLSLRLARQAHMVYDTSAILHAVSLMPEPPDQSEGIVIQMDPPHLSDRDTAVVLARYDDGVVTLGTVMNGYGSLNPMLRPALNSFEAMVAQIHAAGLESYRVALARDMGLQNDSMTVALMRRREEQMRVEHMYQDSILAHVYIPTSARRDYYEANKHQFVTFPVVHFAAIHAATRDSAEALLKRLDSGVPASAILEADSLQGVRRGSLQSRRQNEHGMYQNLLFGVMQPGTATIVGPDQKGELAVIQLLSRDEGHQLPYEQVDQIIDESLRNMQAEEMLLAMLERHKADFRIESHPELVMKIRLVDPLL